MKAIFRELFGKYVNETISPEELIQLKEYIQDPRYNRSLDELLMEVFTDKELAVTADYELDEVFKTLLQRSKADNHQTHSKPVRSILRPLRKNWIKYAAAILLLVGLAAVMDHALNRRSRDNAQPAVATLQKTDVAPGKNQAILTLADGRKVALDSMAKGAISNQGGMAILNANGRISYNSTGNTPEVLYNTITTARGNQYQLVLSDGTRIWLNAGSSLRFPTVFTGSERRVELTGEGYFDVAKNTQHPFIVSFDHTEVRVLGTEFNIMAYSDEASTRTTLVNGGVRVSSGVAQTTLAPGKTAAVAKGAIRVGEADLDQVTAWKNGLLSFNHVGLKEVMRQIGRWYDVNVSYEGNVPDRRLGGVIGRNVNLSVILDFLTLNGVHLRKEGDTVTILPR